MRDREQQKRGRVAAFNPNPRWPGGYFQVLEELGVEEARRPFYAHWGKGDIRDLWTFQQRLRAQFLEVLHQPGTKGIEMDVSDKISQIRLLLAQNRLVSVSLPARREKDGHE